VWFILFFVVLPPLDNLAVGSYSWLIPHIAFVLIWPRRESRQLESMVLRGEKQLRIMAPQLEGERTRNAYRTILRKSGEMLRKEFKLPFKIAFA